MSYKVASVPDSTQVIDAVWVFVDSTVKARVGEVGVKVREEGVKVRVGLPGVRVTELSGGTLRVTMMEFDETPATRPSSSALESSEIVPEDLK